MDQLYQRINDDLELKVPVRNEESEIARFYAGKTVFVTGATGFMGKCLIEKLLRSCPDIKHLYLLMRPKNSYSVEDRTKRYFEHLIFDSLRELNPNFLEKISILNGDLSSEQMGLSEADRNILRDKANIIIHNGANVRFNLRLNLALTTNVLGTKCMLELAEECKNLEMFLYVSSAYSHCYKKKIEEEFYTSPMDLATVYKTIEKDSKFEKGFTKEEVKEIIGDYPNVYTFTKAIAEEVVRQYGLKRKFPIAIYRPSIVTSIYNEPVPGWVGNNNGPVYILIGGGLGIFHTCYHFGHPLDFVPSDFVTNLLIAIAWDCSDKWKTEKKTIIYNFGSSVENPITLVELYNLLSESMSTNLSLHAVWMPWFVFTKKLWVFWILHVLFHFIPACILDIVLLVQGKKTKAVSLFMWASKNLNYVHYFGNGNWRVHIPESKRLISRLNSVDKKVFYCDISKLDWNEYLVIFYRGLKKYYLKEKLDTEVIRRKYNQLWYLHYGSIILLILMFGYFLISGLLRIIL